MPPVLQPLDLRAGKRLRLRLDANGFRIFKLFGGGSYHWAEVGDFKAVRAGPRSLVRFTQLATGQTRAIVMSHPLSGIGPEGSAIALETAGDLADFMASYRLARSDSRKDV